MATTMDTNSNTGATATIPPMATISMLVERATTPEDSHTKDMETDRISAKASFPIPLLQILLPVWIHTPAAPKLPRRAYHQPCRHSGTTNKPRRSKTKIGRVYTI
ncbi:hypothetical protein BJV82DRAFT_599937 [Fennellomyces sp. T-0311]|nr:hypothetical protein BJV82DRAFT_599937 [Fennellomyces sp. T-0311]